METSEDKVDLKTLKVCNSQFKVPQHLKRKVGVIKHRFSSKLVTEFGIKDEETLGPRSLFEPKQLIEAIRRYDGHSVFRVDKVRWAAAVKIVSAKLSVPKVTPLPLDESLRSVIKPDTSSGFPDLTRKDEAFDKALESSRLIAAGRKSPSPCLAYKRTQGSSEFGKPGKVRLIWGYPLEMILLEATCARPILDSLSVHVPSVASGMRRFQLATELDHLRWYPATVSFDWSKFDSSLPTQVISSAFTIAKGMMAEVPSYVDVIQRYFCTCSIVDHKGDEWKGRRKGLPSGSYFTSIIGSICNQLLITYLLLGKGVHFEMKVLGDDSILGVNTTLNTTALVKEAEESFGMVLKPDKMRYKGDLKFLGHDWIKGRPMRPVEESLQRMVYPERLSLDVKPSDLVFSLYSDNAALWERMPFRWKRRALQWYGFDLTGLANWEVRRRNMVSGPMLTL